MVNVKGLVKRTNYDDILAEVEQEKFRQAVKLPDRTAKFILEGPSLQNLEDTEAIEEFEKRKRKQAAREAEIEEIAQDRGVSRAELKLHTKPHEPFHIDMRENDEFDRRTYENTVAESMMVYQTAQARADNVHRVALMMRKDLHQAHKSDPITLYGQQDDTEFYDISDEPDLSTHTPAVPFTERARDAAGSVGQTLATTAHFASKAGSVAGSAAGLTYEAAKIPSHYGPAVAEGALITGVATSEVLYHGTRLTVKSAYHTSQAVAAAASAASNLMQAAQPSHRGRDFTQSHAVKFVGKAANLLLARRALH